MVNNSMISNDKIEDTTKELLKNSFFKYFSKPKKKTSHIILDRFFPDERRKASAIMGLQTSLGKFWETLSIDLAKQNGFNVIDNEKLMKPSKIPKELSTLISEVKREREDNVILPF